MATKKTASKSTKAKTDVAASAKKAAAKVPTGSRKPIDDMSESHRKHIEQWGPHQENLKAEFVWVAVSRFSGHGGEGPYYVCIKRADKDYAIVSYDTSNPKAITKRNVEAEGFDSSTAMLEAFKEFRAKAREERKADAAQKAPAKKAKPASKPKPKRRAAPSKSTKKAPASSTAKKTPTRRRAPKTTTSS